MNRLFRDVPPVNNHRWGSSRLIRAPVLVVDLLTSLGVTPPPCPVTPAEYLPNQPYGAHADSNRIVNMQLYVICKSFYGCSASMLISARSFAAAAACNTAAPRFRRCIMLPPPLSNARRCPRAAALQRAAPLPVHACRSARGFACRHRVGSFTTPDLRHPVHGSFSP